MFLNYERFLNFVSFFFDLLYDLDFIIFYGNSNLSLLLFGLN